MVLEQRIFQNTNTHSTSWEKGRQQQQQQLQQQQQRKAKKRRLDESITELELGKLRDMIRALIKENKKLELEDALEIIDLLYRETKSQQEMKSMKQKIKKKAQANIQQQKVDIFHDMPNDELERAIEEYKNYKERLPIDYYDQEIKQLVVGKHLQNNQMEFDKKTFQRMYDEYIPQGLRIKEKPSKKGTKSQKYLQKDFFTNKTQVQQELPTARKKKKQNETKLDQHIMKKMMIENPNKMLEQKEIKQEIEKIAKQYRKLSEADKDRLL